MKTYLLYFVKMNRRFWSTKRKIQCNHQVDKYLTSGEDNNRKNKKKIMKSPSRSKKCITEITPEKENRRTQSRLRVMLSKTVRKETSSERNKMSGVNQKKAGKTKSEAENTRILSGSDEEIIPRTAPNGDGNKHSDGLVMVEDMMLEKANFHWQKVDVDATENKVTRKKTGQTIFCLFLKKLDFSREDVILHRMFSKVKNTSEILLRTHSLPHKEKHDSKSKNIPGRKRPDGYVCRNHSTLLTLISIAYMMTFTMTGYYLHKEKTMMTVTESCKGDGKQCPCMRCCEAMRCCEEVPIGDNKHRSRKRCLATYFDIAECVDIDIRETGDGRGDNSYPVLDSEDEDGQHSLIVLCHGRRLFYHTLCSAYMFCAYVPLLQEYERIIITYNKFLHGKPDNNRSYGVYHKTREPTCKVRVRDQILNKNSTKNKNMQRTWLFDQYFTNNTLMTRKHPETREFSVMRFIGNIAILYIILMWIKENRNILSKDVSSLHKERFSFKSYFDFHRIIPNVSVLAYPASRGPVDVILAKYFTQNPPTKSEVMAQEMLRICTLHDFPQNSGQSCIRLAQAGFYYEGIDDELVCFSCGVRIRDWIPSHKPLERHRQMSGRCMFIQEHPSIPTDSGTGTESVVSGADSGYGSASGSTALSSEQNSSSTTSEKQEKSSGENHGSTTHRDGNRSCPSGNKNVSDCSVVCQNAHGSLQNSEMYRNDVAQPFEASDCQNDTESKNYASLTTNRTQARYPEYVLVVDRLQSFNRGWPSSALQTPQVMVKSGFYYAGYDDCVRCFQCGIGLRNWEPPDNPDVEHARWSPKCPFLLKAKGQDFINLVLDAVAQLEQRTQDTAASTSSDAFFAQSSNDNNEGKNNGCKMPKEGQLQTATDPSQKAPMVSSIVFDSSKAGNQTARGFSAHSTDYIDKSVIEEPQVKQKTKQAIINAPEVAELKNKNREIREMTVCKICLEEEVSIVFLPCGHLVACAMCAPALSRCAVCRKPITGTVVAKLDV